MEVRQVVGTTRAWYQEWAVIEWGDNDSSRETDPLRESGGWQTSQVIAITRRKFRTLEIKHLL